MVDAATKAEIEETFVRFGEAWTDGDVTTLETLLSPTYTATDINGEFTHRAAWLATVHKRPNASTTMDDIAIRTFGDVAIVTARQIIMHDDGRTGDAGPSGSPRSWSSKMGVGCERQPRSLL